MSHHMYKRWFHVHDEERKPMTAAEIRALDEGDRSMYLEAMRTEPLPAGHRFEAEATSILNEWDLQDELSRTLLAKCTLTADAHPYLHVIAGSIDALDERIAGLLTEKRDLLEELEAKAKELAAAPECPHGRMPRSAGAGHWRDWHRGHGCHLDPDAIGGPNSRSHVREDKP